MLGCQLIDLPIEQNDGYEELLNQVVPLSRADAEYRALVKGIKELFKLKRLKEELSFLPAIKIVENPIQHDRTKHIEIDYNFICEKPTKLLNRAFHDSLDKLDMSDIYAPP
ncbi:hypothetical protein CR513_59457, partial [Mucuna pruriens]